MSLLKSAILNSKTETFPHSAPEIVVRTKMDNDEKAGDKEVLPTNSLEENDPLKEVFPTSPLEGKDRRISSLTKQVEELRNEVSEVTELKESLTKAKAELKTITYPALDMLKAPVIVYLQVEKNMSHKI